MQAFILRLSCSIYWLSAAGILLGGILADSTTDFSGTQGSRSWFYGYFPNGDSNAFTKLPYFNSQTQTWQQSTCCPPMTQVGVNSFAQPNGTNNGQEQWAVREWVSTVSGPIFVTGRLLKVDLSFNSTGVYGRIYHNHQQVYETVLVNTASWVTYSVPLTVAVGDVIDFALAPNGPDNNDLSFFSAIISTTPNTVEVDFSIPTPVHSPSGFLFGLSIQPEDLSPLPSPSDGTIAPLMPVHFREPTSAAWYQRVKSITPNALVDFVMIVNYGVAANNYYGHGAPWLNFPAYEQYVRDLVAPLNPATPSMFFEPWDEPDDGWSPFFAPGSPGYQRGWNGTKEQFFEAYLHAFKAIRSALGPNAQIEGPGFAFYDRDTIKEFLEYCLANGCEVNSLSWHTENDGAPDWAFVTAKDARATFLNDPRYAPLKIRYLDISELVGINYNIRYTGGSLAHYLQFELGGADQGNRSAWGDPNCPGPADNGTLDSLLTCGTRQPRGTWYMHRAYVDGIASRVKSSASDPNITALASSALTSSGVPQILVTFEDYWPSVHNLSEFRSFHLTLKHVDSLPALAGLANVGVRVEVIPDTGESPLTQLQFIESITIPLTGGSLDVDLPPLAMGSVYRVTLVNPVIPVPTVSSVVDHAAETTNLTPGMPMLVSGTGFGSSSADSATVTIGYQVAPILRFNSSTSLLVQVPADAPLGPTALTVSYKGQPSAPFNINLAAVAPEIEPAQSPNGSSFYDSSGAPITSTHPAIPGTEVYCLAIGLGPTNPPQLTNTVTTSQAPTTQAVQVTVVGTVVQPDYAGLFVGGTPGYYQVSFKVPPDAGMGNQPVTLAVGGMTSNNQMLVVGSPFPVVEALVNGASFAGGGIAPGEIATIFGANLTSNVGINLTSGLPLPTNFLDAEVLVNGSPAPLFAIDNVNGQQQINFQVPWEVAGGSNASIAVTSNGVNGAPITVPVLAAQPGIISYSEAGENFGVILHANYQLADAAHPAKPGEVLLIYCTGLGAVDDTPPDGAAASGQITTVTPTVTIGGQKGTVRFSGLAPGFVGLNQVNVQVPAGLASGNQPVVITMPGAVSNTALLPVK